MLKPKLGEQEARMFIQHFEESFDDQFASKSQQLSTKQDVAELRADIEVKMAQMETRIIKWMFIFLIGQAAAIIGVLKLLH
jgi:hypothetical protein